MLQTQNTRTYAHQDRCVRLRVFLMHAPRKSQVKAQGHCDLGWTLLGYIHPTSMNNALVCLFSVYSSIQSATRVTLTAWC